VLNNAEQRRTPLRTRRALQSVEQRRTASRRSTIAVTLLYCKKKGFSRFYPPTTACCLQSACDGSFFVDVFTRSRNVTRKKCVALPNDVTRKKCIAEEPRCLPRSRLSLSQRKSPPPLSVSVAKSRHPPHHPTTLVEQRRGCSFSHDGQGKLYRRLLLFQTPCFRRHLICSKPSLQVVCCRF